MSKPAVLPALRRAVHDTTVTLREVGLREGLQSTTAVLPTADKVELFRGLRAAGLDVLNPVAFVHPGRMPQMADAEEFLRALGPLRDGAVLSGLTLNDAGLDRALVMRGEGLLDGILTVFSHHGAGMAANGITADSDRLIDEIGGRAARAAAAELAVTVFLSGTFGTPEGTPHDPDRVLAAAGRIATLPGVTELLVSDSTGLADPLRLLELLAALHDQLPDDRPRIGVHLHDTRGAGLANALAALASPFEELTLDAAFGGWGGDYPFVAESFGNVATEDLAEMLVGLGVPLAVDVDAVVEVTRRYTALSGRIAGSRLPSASTIAWKRGAGMPR
ncbi:hydroxymethylglutaryl-CoA lyase [Pseudonocardia sp. GCM10023141]|uniref:hydroxymethylglutaryl-CoA lyase n=1 Tax=Pseudonocardia sp. GCM10023141 TaxID=3252653 RepID=UPI00361092E7